jgi:hypothetical protein
MQGLADNVGSQHQHTHQDKLQGMIIEGGKEKE